MSVTPPLIHAFAAQNQSTLKTPYYLIDEARLQLNLEKIARLRELTGTKSVLALKCFSTWSVFDLMRPYLDGTTSSSVYEARLGHEKFGKEVHVYSVAFAEGEVETVREFATKIIFNSVSQLERFHAVAGQTPLGLRLNPGVSHSEFELADPARRYSRLGVTDLGEVERVSHLISGLMFHCNCENAEMHRVAAILDHISRKYERLLQRMEWVSLGGGISFTNDGFAFDAFCAALTAFARRFDVQLYLEPGEAAVAGSGFLVTRVLDVVHNESAVAIVDAGVETHMLDLLVYRMQARINGVQAGDHPCIVAGRTCLAGDVFGSYALNQKVEVGDLMVFEDAASYTMVKKNWFNGIPMPAIVVRRRDGRVDVIKEFGYDDFRASLS